MHKKILESDLWPVSAASSRQTAPWKQKALSASLSAILVQLSGKGYKAIIFLHQSNSKAYLWDTATHALTFKLQSQTSSYPQYIKRMVWRLAVCRCDSLIAAGTTECLKRFTLHLRGKSQRLQVLFHWHQLPKRFGLAALLYHCLRVIRNKKEERIENCLLLSSKYLYCQTGDWMALVTFPVGSDTCWHAFLF